MVFNSIQHAFKGHQLSDEYLLKRSEISTVNKYLSPLLESYFGEKVTVFIQWGDTFSVDCKDVNLDYKLDLCVIADPVEAVTGVFASAKDSACGKYYRDKLKSILVKPSHQFRVPILQVTGQNISLYVFSSIDKQIYSVLNVMDIKHPRNYRKIRDGGIDKILTLFDHVDSFIARMEEEIKGYSRDTVPALFKSVHGSAK
ncbi:hypothetical protein HPULCUR_001704 [Helicostylum pulchrum]|uniref:Uncharacterized protein n=1 Tax=Helicostylum pulchrum TaxID=562976 RepID=A0ABP9XNH6_9FUNG